VITSGGKAIGVGGRAHPDPVMANADGYLAWGRSRLKRLAAERIPAAA